MRPSPECHTPEQLLASADAALYAAKRGGRNQARIARGAPALVPIDTAEGLEGVVQALAAAASIRGGVAPLHCAQVAALSTAVAVELGCPRRPSSSPASAAGCTTAARSRVPTDILSHRGPLDEQARERVRHHAIAGEALVSVVPGLSDAAQVVRSHHERFDGTGYPDGLAGDEIPIAARIVAAADAFVAMTENRPYEGPRGHARGGRGAAAQRGQPLRPARRRGARRRARARAPGRPGASAPGRRPILPAMGDVEHSFEPTHAARPRPLRRRRHRATRSARC